MSQPSLGVMVLCHRRHQLLPLIHEQIKSTWPDAVIQYTCDRPSPAVTETLLGMGLSYTAGDILASWTPAINHAENFIEVRNKQFEDISWSAPRHVAMWDDDHLLADPGEAKAALDAGADLVYATKAYFWDSLDDVNLALPIHTSILFSRWIEGDHWHRMIGAPDAAAALEFTPGGRVEHLKGALLDVGYLTAAERERVWKVYKRAGKIDLLTTGLVKDPTLHRVREALAENVWYQKLECALLAESAGALRLPTRG